MKELYAEGLASGINFIADNGYDSNAVVEAIEAKKMTAVIPPR